MGASVVELGNNFATTEQEIVNFATRIAGSWEIVNFTSAELFGISAGFSSVGITAEAWGTAVQSALIDINTAVQKGWTELEKFAIVAWMNAEDFGKLWEEDASEWFLRFIEWLGESWNEATQVLDSLWIRNARQIRAFLSAATAWDLLRDAVETGSRAYEENTALLDESNKRFEDNRLVVQLAKNEWRAFFAKIWDWFK